MSHHHPDLKLSVRAAKMAKRVGATTVGELARFTEQEILQAKCFGETSLREVKEALARRGLRLGMPPEELVGQPGLQARIVEQGAPGTTPAAEEEDEGDCCGDCRLTAQKLRARSQRNRKLTMSLAELKLPVRATRSLQAKGVATLGELVRLTLEDLAQIRNFGPSAQREVKARLAELGLHLGMLPHAH